MEWICNLHPSLARLCSDDFPWQEVIVGAILGAIVSVLLALFLSAPRRFFSLLKPRYWKLYGRWYRYGVGFYAERATNKTPIYRGRVLILPSPIGSPFLRCSNPTYSYNGRLELLNGMMYIRWTGTTHPERMLSVYREPLSVPRTLQLIGVKSCMTGKSEPAANAEMLSKEKLGDEIVRSKLAKYRPIIVTDSFVADRSYEYREDDEPR